MIKVFFCYIEVTLSETYAKIFYFFKVCKGILHNDMRFRFELYDFCETYFENYGINI